jgi:GAF domain-containing protein
MDPVPETREAFEAMRTGDDSDLASVLQDMGRTAQAIVPHLVGLSIGLLKDGLTFTLVASSVKVSGLDASQYLGGGPCLRDEGQPDSITLDMQDVLDDPEWDLFARASVASGIASSLSLPILLDGSVVGGINLYASEAGAFQDHQDALATALGASARGAVADADLSFTSRWRAALAPVRIRERNDLDTATGLLAARHHESIARAAERVAQAAARAGLSQAVVARVVLALHRT